METMSKEERQECNKQIKQLWKKEQQVLKETSKTYRRLKSALETPSVVAEGNCSPNFETLATTVHLKLNFYVCSNH